MPQGGSKLGGLADLAYGPVVAQPAPVARNNNAGAVWNDLADAADAIGKKLQPAVNDEAARQGAESVQRGPDGTIIAPKRGMIWTEADKAYENAAHLKYMNMAALDLQPKLLDLQQKYANDPQGFESGLDALITGATKNAPPQFQGPITDMLLESGKGVQASIIRQKQQRDVSQSLQTTDAAIEMDRNSLHGWARSGNMEDPQAQIALTRAEANMRAKAGNPLFNYAPANAEQDIAELRSQLKAETILGHVDDMYTRLGEKGAILESEKLLDDPALNISPAERNQITSQARQRIRELHAGTVEAGNELKRTVQYRIDDAIAAGEATGNGFAVLSVDEITRAFPENPQFSAQLIGKITAANEIHSLRKQVRMATPAQLSEMEARYNPEKNGGTSVPTGFNSVWSQFTAPHEGGYAASDGGGGPVNFGINQDANPDIDVKSLTPAKAAKLAKDRYWDKSGAEGLPADMAAIQFETAMNFGVDAAKDMLAKSGGDAKAYLALREAKFREIAKNPAKAKNLPTWLERNADLTNFVNGGNIADKVREYGAFQQAVSQRQVAINNDPAAYVLGARPDISAQLASKDPLVVQNGVRSLLTVQRDIGVPVPAVIDKQQTQAIVASFNNPPDPARRADHMLGLMGDLEGRYGQYYPQVMANLQKAGMPSEAIVLAQVKGDPAVGARMANAINAGRQTLRKITVAPEDIDAEVTKSLSDFNRTLVGQAGSAKAMATQMEAGQLYAYQLAQEGVPNPGARAVADIIGKHYTFADSYRVPSGIDPDQVENGARRLLRDLPEASIMAEQSLNDSRITPQTRQRISSQVLRSQGVWRTMPDDSGLYLAYPQNTGFIPARKTDGKVISFTWGQMTGAADTVPGQDMSDALLKGLN